MVKCEAQLQCHLSHETPQVKDFQDLTLNLHRIPTLERLKFKLNLTVQWIAAFLNFSTSAYSNASNHWDNFILVFHLFSLRPPHTHTDTHKYICRLEMTLCELNKIFIKIINVKRYCFWRLIELCDTLLLAECQVNNTLLHTFMCVCIYIYIYIYIFIYLFMLVLSKRCFWR